MQSRRELLAAGAGAALSMSAGPGLAQAGRGGRDLLILNARVWTLDPATPSAEAVLVRGGRIAYVGDAAGARSRGAGVPVFDAAGRTLVPGFIDGHIHIEAFSESMDFQTALPAVSHSLDEVFAVVRRAVATTPPGRWIIIRGLANLTSQVAEKRMPTRQELDAISATRPIAVFSSPHVVSLNTPALKAVGVWTEREEKALKWRDGTPVGGIGVHRLADGTPHGVATEVQELIWQLQPYTPAELQASYGAHALKDYAAKGITTAINISGSRERVAAITALHRRGEMPLRTRRYFLVPQATGFDDIQRAGLTRGSGDDMDRFGGVKLFIDGAGIDGLGKRIEDYKWDAAGLADIITRCNRAGLPVIMHAVSPGGMNLGLDAVAEAERRAPAGLRHRMDHLHFLGDPAAIQRIKALNLGVGLTRAQKGDGRPRTTPDFRTFLDAGIRVQAVSDSAGSFTNFSPMAGIASLVAPVSEGGVQPAGRELSLDEAMSLYTTAAAVGLYEEAEKGSITVGKFGDFALLSQDPRTLAPGALFDVKVDAVIVGGRQVV
ncbi:amidohydrolase [Phenylobacterium sp.]|jgi:predicted amidohydrolase YtcJ|uniref:amidohydrolase n=1 Tax=Phenylobacterium sp. TaxID=1871053 RepID=UPI00378327DE